jgi:RimJ/RimL family protein N-acetyltransferase
MFETMQGAVIPRNFWNSAQEFVAKGVGITVKCNGEPVSTAYSAFIHSPFLEIGIETSAFHRGKGYALMACAALIDHALCRGFEPVWSCRFENLGSFLLAQKLGFEPVRQIPYYLLPGRGNM